MQIYVVPMDNGPSISRPSPHTTEKQLHTLRKYRVSYSHSSPVSLYLQIHLLCIINTQQIWLSYQSATMINREHVSSPTKSTTPLKRREGIHQST